LRRLPRARARSSRSVAMRARRPLVAAAAAWVRVWALGFRGRGRVRVRVRVKGLRATGWMPSATGWVHRGESFASVAWRSGLGLRLGLG